MLVRLMCLGFAQLGVEGGEEQAFSEQMGAILEYHASELNSAFWHHGACTPAAIGDLSINAKTCSMRRNEALCPAQLGFMH